MGLYHSPKIVTDGLVLCLDAANRKSYAGSGNTWYDMVKSTEIDVSLPTHTNSFGGAFNLNGVDQYAFNLAFANPFAETIIVWARSTTSTWNDYGWISSARVGNGHIIHPVIGTQQINFYLANYVGTISSSLGITDGVDPNFECGDITQPKMYAMSTNGADLHKVYIDDQLRAIDTNAITRETNPTLEWWYLGQDMFFNRYGYGDIFAVQRYNRQLSDDEVKQNFIALRGRFRV